MKDIVFFCQAPADIAHILKEYEELKVKYADDLKVTIVCVNSKAELEYFSNIKLENVYVFYLEYIPISIRKIWKLFSWKKKTIKSIKDLEFLYGDKTFYFCSIYDDVITAFHMHYLYQNRKKIIYLNHYDNEQNIIPINKITDKQIIYEKIYFLVTGIKYKFWDMSGRWNVIRFPIEDVAFREKQVVLDSHICKKYAYKINTSKYKKAVMLFSQPNREKSLLSDDEHDKLHILVVLKLKELGYTVFTKGHPRMGICQCLKNIVDEEIPQVIPSELIDLYMFKFCIGFVSFALSSSAKLGIPAYSFISLIKSRNEHYDGLITFTDTTSENKIKFIHSLDELEEI
jgi:hypothetical protein